MKMSVPTKMMFTVIVTVVVVLLAVKGLCSIDSGRPWAWTRLYLPATGEVEAIQNIKDLEYNLEAWKDYGNRIAVKNNELCLEMGKLKDELRKATDPNLVYDSEQDVYMPVSWVDDPVGVVLDVRCSGRWDGECDYYTMATVPIIQGAIRIPEGSCPKCGRDLQYYMSGTPDPALENRKKQKK